MSTGINEEENHLQGNCSQSLIGPILSPTTFCPTLRYGTPIPPPQHSAQQQEGRGEGQKAMLLSTQSQVSTLTSSTQNPKVLISITAQEGFRKGLGCHRLSAAGAVEKGFTCQRESDPGRLSCE